MSSPRDRKAKRSPNQSPNRSPSGSPEASPGVTQELPFHHPPTTVLGALSARVTQWTDNVKTANKAVQQGKHEDCLAALCPMPKSCYKQVKKVRGRVQGRFFMEAIDSERSTGRSHRLEVLADGGKDSHSGSHKKLSMVSSLANHIFGLPPIELEYELDTNRYDYIGFGFRLKRYIHKKTKMPRAALIIPKKNIPPENQPSDIERQLQTLCKIDHPNIVSFREACEDRTHLKLVFEWLDGGPMLFQLWKFVDDLTEYSLAQIIREIMSALAAAHTFGVHHLDLSLYSLFLMFPDRLSPVKLFGVGIAGFLLPLVPKRDFSKSNKHLYASPELFFSMGNLRRLVPLARHACDMWSVGAILYTLCSGKPPFGAGTIEELSFRVQRSVWTFGIEFSEYSIALKDMIESLLRVPWQRRPTAGACLQSVWLEFGIQSGNDVKLSQQAVRQMTNFMSQDPCKQTVARVIADIGLTVGAYRELEKVFRELDTNSDGTITLQEIKRVSDHAQNVDHEAVNTIIRRLDRNGNASVDITEFIAALVMEQDEADERLVKKAFEKMDKDKDARVSKKELFTVLRQYSGTITLEQVSRFVQQNDMDGDSKIDYPEFLKLFPAVRVIDDVQVARMAKYMDYVGQAPDIFAEFKEDVQEWVHKMKKLRARIKIASGMQEPEEAHRSVPNWSYEKGHLTEYDMHNFIRIFMSYLKHPPGNFETKVQREARKKHKQVEGGVMGLAILTGGRGQNRVKTETKHKRDDGGGSGSDSGSESDGGGHINDSQISGLDYWAQLVFQNQRFKKIDPEWSEVQMLTDNLFFLFKVRNELQWYPFLRDAVAHMCNLGVEQYHEVIIKSKFELQKISSSLSEEYKLKEAGRMGQGAHGIIFPKDARILPVEAFQGKDLNSPIWLQRMNDLAIPCKIVFSWPKTDINQGKLDRVRQLTIQSMIGVANFIDGIIGSIESLIDEVQTDMEANLSLEGKMPFGVPSSEAFLKFCEGRDLEDDALTPRSEDLTDSDEERQAELKTVQKRSHKQERKKEREKVRQKALASSQMLGEGEDRGEDEEQDLVDSDNGITYVGNDEVAQLYLKNGKKIERNKVIMKQVKLMRAAEQRAQEEAQEHMLL